MRTLGQCEVKLPANVEEMGGGDAGPLRILFTVPNGWQFEPFGELNEFDGFSGWAPRTVMSNAQSQAMGGLNWQGDFAGAAGRR